MEASSYEGWLLVLISSVSCILGAGVVFMGSVLENKRFLSGSMALGAGVLFCNSQFILLPAAYEKLNSVLWVAVCFVLGLMLTAGMTKLVSCCTPHALHTCDSLPTKSYGAIPEVSPDQKNYYLIGLQTAIAISVHKFPEGLIMFISNESSSELGISVATAMVIHNLMEGLLIALPFYYATHSHWAAFSYASLLGGLSQPLGALIGLFTIRHVDEASKDTMFGLIFAVISGMMYMVLLKSMLPQAIKSSTSHWQVFGFFLLGIWIIVLVTLLQSA
ncbi:ZIP zinc transporter-domain-containing protein [Sporodiniella umbellata]|nr:ZIP zinc transporter-domain-containing protein [Sporodiniella umbellata]